ncbi:GNAT family N-acetyltransferase [Pseudomonas sp. OTU2001]|uniref:GNAT family N-acetyltransferase n=1 Tax=Pseudomonas sp. OTU2001 TaxID=3043859 RepID=UPI00313F3CD0
MLNFPAVDASDDDWDEFTDARSEELVSNLRDFIVERFAYKPRYVQQQVSSSFGTVSAKTKKFDLYFRLFANPDHICPRDCLIIARIGFKQQRAGHGSALVRYLLELAPTIGYGHVAIECANANSAAFAERLGFSPFENRRHWVGSVDAVREALLTESLANS